MGNKKFRDPIYGYIEVDEQLIEHIIDTSTFQRLRDIIQTSYAPLYSSAVHNRFVHSIGVYHLGRLVTQTITPFFHDDSLNNTKQYNKIFELACLLHDVGHAPFSHTGEMLYLKEGDRGILHSELVALTGDESLETEIVRNAYKAAPHELMSAIVHDIFNEEYLKENYLTNEGVQVSGIGRVRLISDADIRYLMKNLPESALCNEYYDRRLRKHPIWKTEAEFQAIFEGRENDLSIIKEEFDSLKDYLRSQGLPFLINENALASCKAEVEQLQADLVDAQDFAREKVKSAIAVREAHIRWMEIFDRFASEQHIDFEFLIIYTDQFNSGFRKQEFENIEILFPELKQPCRFGAVSNVLKSEKSKGEKFFFLYYTRETAMQSVSITGLIGEMLRLASEMSLQKAFNDRFV